MDVTCAHCGASKYNSGKDIGSHGICAECKEIFLKELAEYKSTGIYGPLMLGGKRTRNPDAAYEGMTDGLSISI